MEIHNINIIPHIIPEKAAYLFLRKINITDVVFVNPLATNKAISAELINLSPFPMLQTDCTWNLVAEKNWLVTMYIPNRH